MINTNTGVGWWTRRARPSPLQRYLNLIGGFNGDHLTVGDIAWPVKRPHRRGFAMTVSTESITAFQQFETQLLVTPSRRLARTDRSSGSTASFHRQTICQDMETVIVHLVLLNREPRSADTQETEFGPYPVKESVEALVSWK